MLILFLGLTVLATAQSLDALLDRSGFSRAERTDITRTFNAAREAGIPEEILRPRLAEGIAKNVPAARLTASLRREIARLLEAEAILLEVEAEQLLGNSATWARAANLLDAGVEEQSLQALALATVAVPEHFRPASTLLVSLRDWGLEEDDATALATAAASSPLDPDAYPVIMEMLIQGRRSRLPVDQMIERLLEEVPETASAAALRRALAW